MTLYLKYRPQGLDELDLTSVAESLKKIVASGNIPHAFLFAGPKGTGKTSAARILAKIINCEHLGKNGTPCDKCDQCKSIANGSNLDVIELDAASHRGIDDIRTLRDAVKLAPVKANKKIYIIDEAHMLTTEASNALLKTLEEPPAHVVFILATTNPEKLIDTIRSRTTLIYFAKATEKEIVRSLKRVAIGEQIKIDDESLAVIAGYADGAFRDAIKVLEQIVSENIEFSKESLEQYLLNKKLFDTEKFIKLLTQKEVKPIINEIGEMVKKGASIEVFLKSLISKLRLGLLALEGVGLEKIENLSKSDLITLIELFLSVSNNISDSVIEELPLEIAVIKWCGKNENNESGITNHEEVKNDETKITGEKVAEEKRSEVPDSRFQIPDSNIDDEIWKNILATVRPINASIEALLRAAKPIGYDGKNLTLGVYYKFHKERLEDGQHRRVLEDIVAKILQAPTRVVCILTEPPPRKIIEEAKKEPVLTESGDQDIINVAKEIFGN